MKKAGIITIFTAVCSIAVLSLDLVWQIRSVKGGTLWSGAVYDKQNPPPCHLIPVPPEGCPKGWGYFPPSDGLEAVCAGPSDGAGQERCLDRLIPLVFPIVLKVKLNGKDQPPPDQVHLEFEGESGRSVINISVKGGLLPLPSEFGRAKNVSISFNVASERIRLSGIDFPNFAEGVWTILLEDKKFSDDYKWATPKGAKIRSSCIWVLQPVSRESVTVFVQGCRIAGHR
jgi:hypothetical protein